MQHMILNITVRFDVFAIALENTSLVDYKLNDNVKPP